MKTNLLAAWVLLLGLTSSVLGQSSKQVLTVETLADLRARRPQTNEVVQVRHGSSSNLWAAPRTFVHDPSSAAAADNVFVTTNASASGRYEATDLGSGVFDVRWFGAIPGDGADDTAAIQAAAAALQSAGGGTLLAKGGAFLVRDPSGSIVMKWTNLANVTVDASSSKFYTDDLADSTFASASMVASGTTVTATTATAHGLTPGDTVVVKNSSVLGYDGPYTVATATATNVFTFTLSGYSTPVLPATALVRKAHYYSELLRFDACTNVVVRGVQFEGTVHPRDIQYRLGWIVMNVRKATRGVSADLDVTGAAYGLYCGDYDTPANGNSTGLDLEVDAKDVGYPVSVANSGHDSRYVIRGESLHRGMYAGALKRAKVEAWIKDYEPAGVIATHDPAGGTLVGCEDLDVTIHDTGTSEEIKLLAVGGTRYVFTLAGYPVAQPATHRNIRVRIFGKDIPDASLFQILTYDTQHTVDGFEVGGFVDNRGLALGDTRNDFYVDQKSVTSGVFRDIAIRNLTILSPDSVGSYTARFHVTNLVNDVVVDRFETGQPKNFSLPPGRSVATVPALPGWDFESFEQGLLANKANGARLNNTTLRHTLAAELGAGDFTLLWAGTIPYDGNPGLFALGSATNGVSPSGLGLSLTNADLQLRFFGSTSNDWRALTVTNWQTDYQLKQASIAVVRDINGVRLYADGRQLLAVESTNGTPPAWTDALTGTNWLIGTESIGTTYAGTVLKIGAWNFARSDDLPELASGFGTGQSSIGAASAVVDSATLNGGMETAGGGGSDVLANWSENTAGSSTLTSSAVARSGSASVAFNVDSGNSIAGISQTGIATVGQTYRLSVWVRNQAGTGGAISIVGAADGESIQQLTSSTNWQQFTLTKVWGDTTLVIKRADGANRTFLVDDVEFKAVGAFADLDFTLSPQDRVTGRWAEVRGGAASGIRVRDAGVSSDRGDASVTLRAGHDEPIQVFASSLTAPRTVTFATDHVRRGDFFRIVRTGAGAGSLTAAGSQIANGEWADFAFDGSQWSKVASGGGTLARTPDWINVMDYGAVGDATTDDTAAVQAAIDAVKVSGGTVYFPEGRYRLSQSLDGTTAATGFSIQGAGKENTVILGSDPGYPLLDFTGANGVSLRDLTVWGNAAGTNVSLCGILWGRPASNASSGEHHMERVKVWGNFQKWGVIANSAELCVYRDCEFYAGYNLAPPDNAMTAFCLSGGSGTRGLTSRYNAPGNGSGGNSSQSFYDCKFFNYVPTTVAGYATTYNLELDGVMTCTMINPYYYSRYNGTQVKLNNLSTTAFDTLDIIGARHEYFSPLSGGTEPASYSAAAAEKFKSIRIQGGTLTYFYGEGGSWITGLKINDVMWKTIASVPVVDVWILIDSDLTANKGGEGSFAQTQTPTYSIRGWSHNVNLDYQRTQQYGMHSAPDLGFGRRGLLWDGATDNSALLYNIPTNRIGTNDFTIYLRVRLPASMPGNHAGIATLTANPSGIVQAGAWTARLNTDGRIETFLFDATGLQSQSKYVPLDFYTQNKGEICDLVFVRNTNDCRVYINGYYARGDEDQSTGSPPGWGANVDASVFALGISGAASQYWRSEIYRAALFDRALTDTEILSLTHSTFTLDTDALIPNVTQGYGTEIVDLGSGSYTGTLVGGVSHLLKQIQGGGGTNTWKIEANGVEVVEPDITDTSTVEWTAVGSVLSGAIKTGSIGTNLLTGSAYSALKDLGTATGTLAGSAVGSGINDDNVDFDDADGLWTATTLGAALEELNDSINAGAPNGTGAKVHWSQLLGVPAGFADGTDDGAGGGSGDVVGPASATDDNIATFNGTTGKLIQDGGATIASLATEAEVAAGYEPLDANKYQSTNVTLTAAATSGSTGGGAFVRADSPTVTGTWSFDLFTANTLTVLSNLYAVSVAYGAGWNGSSNVPTRDAVYDEMELRLPKASGAMTGTPTVNGTNLMAAVDGKQGMLVNSAGLASALADETGTGVAVFSASPALTGSPTVPTAAAGTSNTVAASTKYVDDAVAAGGGSTSPTTTRGDMIVRGASADARLPIGGIGAALVSNGTDPIWGDVSTVTVMEEEFFAGANPTGWSTTGTITAGTGANTNHIGVFRLRYTTAAAGMYQSQTAVVLGGGKLVWDIIAKQDNLSDGTDPLVTIAGLYDSGTATNATDGVFFMAAQGLNSGNWTAVTRNNTTQSATDTGVAVSTEWTRLGCIIDNATSATFFINGVPVATNTMNLPIGAGRESGMGYITAKSAGSTERNHYLDVIRMRFFPTVGR